MDVKLSPAPPPHHPPPQSLHSMPRLSEKRPVSMPGTSNGIPGMGQMSGGAGQIRPPIPLQQHTVQQSQMHSHQQISQLVSSLGQYPGSGAQMQPKIGRAVQQECRDRSRMPSSA
eukprot:TRINITY_DN47651_c0_g1_i1.p1 TRINITY_DN47651_c0_g1~~TRINITY_DN47651_c0_g1_i1.p1  ORF type:complete len:115 (+),score=12.35 TRINITY_DN47651_c0_g1_i1:114-458(+)